MTNPRAHVLSALKATLRYIAGHPEMFGAAKSYDQYRARLWGAMVRLFNGGRDANFLATFVRSIDQQLTQAWNTGAGEIGVAPEEMTPDDMTILEAIIDNETNFIEGVAADIQAAKDEGMTREDFDTQFGSRVDLWANRYNETQNRARMHFGAKERLEWVLGATEESCDTCTALNGIVAFGYEWEEARIHPQMPPNNLLTCGGWQCDCQLRPTTRRRTARALDRLLDLATARNV
jgi:hypothetical protein